MAIPLHEEFLVDPKGRPKAVVINIREYRKLLRRLEDLEDVRYIKSHLREKSFPLEEIAAQLKDKGRVA